MLKRVAIIGAGPAGLMAAYEALNYGLKPIIFEQSGYLGGVWSPDGSTWPGMQTNLSKTTCSLPDYPWSSGIPDFPTREMMDEYLTGFALEKSVFDCIHFHCPVVNAQPREKGWLINSFNGDEKFDFLAVASGIFSKRFMPQIPEKHKGSDIIHSRDYKGPAEFKGKKVAVVGGGFSGVEIAASLGQAGVDITHVFRSPFNVVPRYFEDEDSSQIPIDHYFYHREHDWSGLTQGEVYQKLRRDFAQTSGQINVPPALQVDFNSQMPTMLAVSDTYIPLVKEGKIKPFKGNIGDLDETFDVMIYATGYECSLPFFGQDVKNRLGFVQEDKYQPLLLHLATWAQGLRNLAFIGMNRGPYFPVMDLQAKWAMKVFAGKMREPSEHDIERGVAKALEIRHENPRRQFPNPYVPHLLELAGQLGSAVDMESIPPKIIEVINKPPEMRYAELRR